MWGFHGAESLLSLHWSETIPAWPPQDRSEGLRPVLGKGQVLRQVCAGRGMSMSILFSPTACPPGSYKAKQGEGPCLPCPPNSRTTSPAASICICHSNFYRADSDPADSACTSE